MCIKNNLTQTVVTTAITYQITTNPPSHPHKGSPQNPADRTSSK